MHYCDGLWHYGLLAILGSTTVPIRQQRDKEHLPQWSLDRVREADKPVRDPLCPKTPALNCANPDAIKSRHEFCSDAQVFAKPAAAPHTSARHSGFLRRLERVPDFGFPVHFLVALLKSFPLLRIH
jgi:hypothetical protein